MVTSRVLSFVEVARVIVGTGHNRRVYTFEDYVATSRVLGDEIIFMLHRGVRQDLRGVLKNKSESGSVSRPKVLLPERLEFISVYCSKVRVGIRFGAGRPYAVFCFDQIGYAVADCDQYGNAIYVFEMVSGWEDQVNTTKESCRDIPCFRCKINHIGDWQGRLLQAIGLTKV